MGEGGGGGGGGGGGVFWLGLGLRGDGGYLQRPKAKLDNIL